MRMKKLYTHHSIYLLFAVCWLSYFSAYLGRLNFTACIAAINEAENLSKLELGRVSSAFFVCYGGAQLFSGLLADRLRFQPLCHTSFQISGYLPATIFLPRYAR